MTHATPRPWKVDENARLPVGVIRDDEDGEGVCVMEYDPDGSAHDKAIAQADAALIVHAVNTLDEAKAALHAAYEELSQQETSPQDRVEVLSMVRQVLEKMT